jgi:glycogen debranching enzyme
MPDTLHLDERFAILAETERPSVPSRVLKHGDTFAIFDERGDISGAAREHGLFHGGTRFLSRLELLLAGRPPLLLSSTVSTDNVVFAADFTNPDVVRDGQIVVSRGLLHAYRTRTLWQGAWLERIRITNHALRRIETTLTLRFDADYVDIFEVRGMKRSRRGERLQEGSPDSPTMAYRGLDGVVRQTHVRPKPQPTSAEPGGLTWTISLDAHEHIEVEMAIACMLADDDCFQPVGEDIVPRRGGSPSVTSITTSNEAFNHWLRRSDADIAMLLTETPQGTFPYAGIPWFSTPFGRDGLITALELLWIRPEIARGVLTFLAAHQATDFDDARDAEPGKILHEMRTGEMPALSEVPFGKYYGSADSTPLFIMLADAYFARTADGELIDRLWPHVRGALDWITRFGDADGDGFIEYARKGANGLLQQGWKDSNDSVFHADGTLAEPPIALCEVQAYAYGAWRGAARLAEARGDAAAASEWNRRAEALRRRFEEMFWCADLGTYALALDGRHTPCRVPSSNAGQCLWTGIASVERARLVAEGLLSDKSFSGWGIRTIQAGVARYNPMSYHNGTVWPHDNALIAAGFARYGLTQASSRILQAMFDLSAAVDLHRLPELICGFHRRTNEAPTLYPVACAPQAWAAGAVFMLLQSALGLDIDATSRTLSIHRGVLPDTLEWVRITNLVIADASVDLLLTRHPFDVSITVLRREGEVQITSVK